MKKALIMTSVAFVLFLAVIAAGLNVVFTVTYIDAAFSTFSAQGEEDAKELKKELDGFVGKSTTFLDLSSVNAKVEQYPCFQVESIKKKFPKTVEISVKERKELFAYKTAEGKYAMIDSDGICLRMSDENVSRTGGENILLTNFNLTVEVGALTQGNYFEALLTMFLSFGTCFGDARANVREVTLGFSDNEDNPLTNHFDIEMQEGVFLEIYDPISFAAEKAEKAAKFYEALGDVTRMYGCITVTGGSAETINAAYFPHRFDHNA